MEKNIKTLTEYENKLLKEKLKEPFYIKIIKLLIILIPVLMILYILSLNFIINQAFLETYDIGSEKDYLSPADRVSDKGIEGDITYKNLTSQLVYFNVPVIRGADYIIYEIKFKDEFPDDGRMLLGAKNKEEWSYANELIYSKTLEKLIANYPYKSNGSLLLIKLNRNAPDYTINDIFESKAKTRLATDQDVLVPGFKINNYSPGELIINEPLRETQKFYIYAKGDLNVEVKKRDLNWYLNNETGEDKLEMNLYDLSGKLISSSYINDDGIVEKKVNKEDRKIQQGSLFVPNLKEGAYRLELKNNGDMVITQIKINQNKAILLDRVFLAGSSVYFTDIEKESSIYFKSEKPINLELRTYHGQATNQTVNVNGNYKTLIEKVNFVHYLFVQGSNDLYELESPKNDMIVTGPRIFSFSNESYFNPLVVDKIPYKDDISYLEKNADYVLVEYTPVKSDGEWKIATKKFYLNELYINNEKLNMLISTPHLNVEKNSTAYIPIDWIKINTYKPGKI